MFLFFQKYNDHFGDFLETNYQGKLSLWDRISKLRDLRGKLGLFSGLFLDIAPDSRSRLSPEIGTLVHPLGTSGPWSLRDIFVVREEILIFLR